MSRWFITLLACLLCLGASAQSLKPERIISGSEIISSHDPSATVTLPHASTYVGADRWILYGIADCELHVFVEADAQKRVQRLYWVQFEGYVPEKPELKHDYKDPVRKVWGSDFHVRAQFGPGDQAARPNSDLEHVNNLVRAAGYTMPASILNVRLVHLLDDAKRRELMIIYTEDAALSGVSSWKDLAPASEKAGDWKLIQKGLLARAKKNVVVQMR